MTSSQPIQDDQRDWLALEQQYYQHTFARLPVTFDHGRGVRLYDTNGQEYLDLVAGIAVNVLGHCHPAVVEAIREQAGALIHISNLYVNKRQIELAEELFNLSGGMRSFFSNSGAEANEGAIKLARKFARKNRPGAYGIISMDRSFHGRTLATTAATGQKKYQDTWQPLPEGFIQVPFNDLEAVKTATTDKICGILVEAVQGEGGIYPVSTEYWQGLRQWCDENNLILIADEIQSGIGRTGKFFSWEHFDARPDIITLAKGLAGGVPIGAMLAAPRVDVFEPGDHGTTFGGNPIACAAALATIRTIRNEHLLENAKEVGDYLKSKLLALQEKYDFISGVRGLGLMQAFDVANEKAAIVAKTAFEHHVLITNAGTGTVRLIPPLILSRSDVDEAIKTLDEALSSVQL
jgi:acetylornithine/N-succinyldiaminopimelate aminotransferase